MGVGKSEVCSLYIKRKNEKNFIIIGGFILYHSCLWSEDYARIQRRADVQGAEGY
jgi:hypothetical protein